MAGIVQAKTTKIESARIYIMKGFCYQESSVAFELRLQSTTNGMHTIQSTSHGNECVGTGIESEQNAENILVRDSLSRPILPAASITDQSLIL